MHLLSRGAPRSTLPASSGTRIEVRPPSLCHAPDSAWQRFMFWLLAPAPYEAAPPLNRMPAVRADFLETLHDIHTLDAKLLKDRIGFTRSLRELWHLRTEVYRVVAVAQSQAAAEERVAELNRHFPTRSPRSGFAPLV
jgi:hypothetical protein